jgi:hypothetical protein
MKRHRDAWTAAVAPWLLGAADNPPAPAIPQRSMILGLVWGLAGTVLLIALMRFVLPWLVEHWRNSRRRLFGNLCRAHHIPLAQRRLLKRIASEIGLAHPVMIFLEPDKFRAAIMQPEWDRHRRELRTMEEELFSTPRG